MIFSEIQTARKRHRCDDCRDYIDPGTTYARGSATPHDEFFDTGRWSHMKAHHPYGSCPRYQRERGA